MNAPMKAKIPTVPGTPFEGGFYVAQFRLADSVYALIASGADAECGRTKWISGYVDVLDARSFNDGLSNTNAMAAAGSALAKSIRELRIADFDDWYLPSRDEVELAYRYLKPTTETNYTYRSGENPSALPATHPYTEDLPLQTPASGFQEGGEYAFDAAGYWSSTQYSRNGAWTQVFVDGHQDNLIKSAELRARAFRRFKVE